MLSELPFDIVGLVVARRPAWLAAATQAAEALVFPVGLGILLT